MLAWIRYQVMGLRCWWMRWYFWWKDANKDHPRRDPRRRKRLQVRQLEPRHALTGQVWWTGPASAAEGDPVNFGLQRQGDQQFMAAPLIVYISTQDTGSAVGGGQAPPADYQARSNHPITFPANQPFAQAPIQTFDDWVAESNETFLVDIVSAPGADIVGTDPVQGTITPPPAQVKFHAPTSVVVIEGARADFGIEVLGQGPVDVRYRFHHAGTSDNDFEPAPQKVVTLTGLAAGIHTISYQTHDDTRPEEVEDFWLEIFEARGASIVSPSIATGTIYDDDISVFVTGGRAPEGNQVEFVVQLSGPAHSSQGNIVVHYETFDESPLTPTSAQAGLDYEYTVGTLTFTPGQTKKFVYVNTTEESPPLDELNERFLFKVTVDSGPAVPWSGRSEAKGIIVDNDGTPKIDVSNEVVLEGELAAVTLTLSEPSQDPVYVTWFTEDGSALAGSDYEGHSDTVIAFPYNETEALVVLATFPSPEAEKDEQFKVKIKNPVNATLGKATGNVVITENPAKLSGYRRMLGIKPDPCS